jgi:hypothetical protein
VTAVVVAKWWFRASRAARGYDFGIACFNARHSPVQATWNRRGTPVRHLNLVFRLARRDHRVAAIAGQTGA